MLLKQGVNQQRQKREIQETETNTGTKGFPRMNAKVNLKTMTVCRSKEQQSGLEQKDGESQE